MSDLVQFTVSNIVNPLSFEPTDSFQVYVTTSRIYDYYVNQLTYGLSLLNTWAGNLSNV